MKNNGKKQSDLSLSNLTMPEFNGEEIRRGMKELEEGEEKYKQMYGDEWWPKYLHDLGILRDIDYDEDMKTINEGIYCGEPFFVSGYGEHVKKFYEKQESRMREIYGKDYDTLRSHEFGDLTVVERLLNDAIKTGKWKELPDELQDEYHKRIGGFSDK